MKHFNVFLLLIFLFLIKFSTHGQVTNQSDRELYQQFVEGINPNDLETDFILNRGFINPNEIESLYQFLNLEIEESKEIISTVNKIDARSWFKIYANLLESQIVSSKKLSSLKDVKKQFKGKSSSKDVPIFIFDVEGELLDKTELDRSTQKSIKTTQYHKVHLFGVTSSVSHIYKKTVNFNLNSKNYFSGFNSKETSIFIDFGDGNGMQEYSTSHGIITVDYKNLGEKLIKVYRNKTVNGVSSKIGSAFVIKVIADLTESPNAILKSNLKTTSSKNDDPNFSVEVDGATAYVFYGNDNQVLDNLVINLHGFDPLGTTDLDSQRAKYANLENEVRNQNFDFVYIILENTQLPLQQNVNTIKNLIQQFNVRKQGNFETKMIGESMGGLLTRMALKQFENENYDHQVGLYVSFDAPHQGANLPPGFQHLGKDILELQFVQGFGSALNLIDQALLIFDELILSLFTDYDEGLEFVDNIMDTVLESLNSPGAKSLMHRHIEPNNYYRDTQNYLQELGYPSQSRNIALVNGSYNNNDTQMTVDNNPLNPGEILINLDLDFICNGLTARAWTSPSLPNTVTPKVSQIRLRAGFPVPNIIWERRCWFIFCWYVPVFHGTKCINPINLNKEKYFTFQGGSGSYDDAPGSTFTDLFALNTDTFTLVHLSPTFVPTASAIDISSDAYNHTIDPNGLKAIQNKTVLDNLIINDLTPFDEVYAKDGNSKHVNFDAADAINFQKIRDDEFMHSNLEIQDKEIKYNRDFSSLHNIRIGNDVNTRSAKIFKNGDVIIKDNATVNFESESVLISPGTHLKDGTNVTIKTKSNSEQQKNNIELLEDNFKIKLIGAKQFNFNEKPSFKVLTSNLDIEYDYSWTIIDNNQINSATDELIIEDILYPGSYTVKASATSKKSGITKTLTKVFTVNLDLKNSVKEDNSIVKISNDVKVYPNPVINSTTIMAKKNISKITLFDITSKNILEVKNINKIWHSLDLTILKTGAYFLEIQFMDNSKSVNKKILKE